MAFTSEWEVRSSSSFVPVVLSAGVGQSGLEPQHDQSLNAWDELVFDLVKPESEWGEPGPPTAVPDLPDQLGPCMCTPRRHR
jgi:hypothetical protein